MQIKTAMPVRVTIIKKNTNNKCWWGCRGKGTLVHCWWECKLMQPLLSPHVLKMQLLHHFAHDFSSRTLKKAACASAWSKTMLRCALVQVYTCSLHHRVLCTSPPRRHSCCLNRSVQHPAKWLTFTGSGLIKCPWAFTRHLRLSAIPGTLSLYA